MPPIKFPSVRFPNPSENQTVASFTGKEGCEAKFHVLYNNQRFIFKPANRARLTSVKFGYIHYSKGWVTEKHHPAKILNELIAFRANQLLNLSRVPPVVPFELPLEQLLQTMQQRKPIETLSEWFSSYVYTSECRMDFQVGDAWVISRRNRSPMVIGSLQLQVDNIVERTQKNPWYGSSWLPFQENQEENRRGSGVTRMREQNTRLLYDYLIGNWDRQGGISNDFIHKPPQGQARLIYIDQNALRQVPAPFPLHWRGCRFFKQPIRHLQQVNWTAEALWADFLREYELVESWSHEGILHVHHLPWKHWQQRADKILEYFQQCLEKHGSNYVYQAA